MNKSVLLFALILLTSCAQNPKDDIERLDLIYFPEKRTVLSSDYDDVENLMPLAIVRAKLNGEEIEIPIVYACFDPSGNYGKGFPAKDDIDHYSFNINENGSLSPNFDTINFNISEGFQDYFQKSVSKYNKSRKTPSKSNFIRLHREVPGWWQGDATPTSKDGKKSIFICQAAMSGAVNDEGMMYVFYDSIDKQIDVVIQRD